MDSCKWSIRAVGSELNIYAPDFDPRIVRIGLLEGWDREREALNES